MHIDFRQQAERTDIETSEDSAESDLPADIQYWLDVFKVDRGDFLRCPSLQAIRIRLQEGHHFFAKKRERGKNFSHMRKYYRNPDIQNGVLLHRRSKKMVDRAIRASQSGDGTLAICYCVIAHLMVEHAYTLVMFRETGRRERRKYGKGRSSYSRPPNSIADNLLHAEWSRSINNPIIESSE